MSRSSSLRYVFSVSKACRFVAPAPIAKRTYCKTYHVVYVCVVQLHKNAVVTVLHSKAKDIAAVMIGVAVLMHLVSPSSCIWLKLSCALRAQCVQCARLPPHLSSPHPTRPPYENR